MDRLVQRLTKLAAAFPRDNATEATLAVYAEELVHLEPDAVCAALDTLIRSSRRFPTLADIISEYHAEREREWERMRRESYTPGLPVARAPMPESLRQRIHAMHAAFEARSAAMNLQPGEADE